AGDVEGVEVEVVGLHFGSLGLLEAESAHDLAAALLDHADGVESAAPRSGGGQRGVAPVVGDPAGGGLRGDAPRRLVHDAGELLRDAVHLAGELDARLALVLLDGGAGAADESLAAEPFHPLRFQVPGVAQYGDLLHRTSRHILQFGDFHCSAPLLATAESVPHSRTAKASTAGRS